MQELITPAVTFSFFGVLLLINGIAFLRRSWLGKRPRNLLSLIFGWFAVAAGIALFCHAWGGEVGTAYALLVFSLAAFLVIAFGFEDRSHRRQKVRDVAPEPEERSTNWRRATAKALLSIVLAGVAAIGIGVAFAVSAPMETHDRIVIGGLLVPVLWGGGMAWTLADAKLVRATLLLLLISALSYGIAFLPKALAL